MVNVVRSERAGPVTLSRSTPHSDSHCAKAGSSSGSEVQAGSAGGGEAGLEVKRKRPMTRDGETTHLRGGETPHGRGQVRLQAMQMRLCAQGANSGCVQILPHLVNTAWRDCRKAAHRTVWPRCGDIFTGPFLAMPHPRP